MKKVSVEDTKKSTENLKNHPLNFHPLGKISPYFSWFILRYFPIITPNEVSIAWGIIGIIGIIVMSLGGYWNMVIGILIFHFAIFLDYVDGEMARYLNKRTIGGTHLDLFFSAIFRSALLIGVGIGVYNSKGEIIYLYLGLICGFLFIFDNVNKLKIYETFVIKNKLNGLKNSKNITKEGTYRPFSENWKNGIKIYGKEMLRPNNPFTLLFFCIIFNIAYLYLILMTLISIFVFIKNFIKVYSEFGNMAE